MTDEADHSRPTSQQYVSQIDIELVKAVPVEDWVWAYPDQIAAVAQLDAGIAILNETADADRASAALAEIIADPVARFRLEKAAVRYAYETQHPRPFRQGQLRDLLDKVAAAQRLDIEIDQLARPFFEAAGALGFRPQDIEKARGGTAYFRYQQLEETLTQIHDALIEGFGDDHGGQAPVSEKVVGTPFDRFTETFVGLWRASGRGLDGEDMRDFEAALRALSEGVTGKDQPVRWWRDLRRKLRS